MARRTPGLQPRSQVHSYWGQFQYDTSVPPATFSGRTGDVGSSLLPNASVASLLAASEFAKLEAGDTAATIDTTVAVDGAEFGLWTCISPGTVGVGNAVWVRMDNASLAQQTIRDAHRIVVGISGATTGVPATDTLLNLSPYTAGVSADFIDTGDGAALALAIATAGAMTGVVPDVRIVAGSINLNTGAVVTPLAIPAGVKLLGAGSALTTIKGRTDADQGVFTLGSGSSLESLTVSSAAPVTGPGTSQGVIQASGISAGSFSVRDVSIEFEDSVTRVAKAGLYAIAPGSGGTKSCTIDNVQVTVAGSLITTGILVEGYVRSSIRNCTVTGSSLGLQFNAGAGPILGNEAGSIINFKGYDIQEIGINISALTGSAMFGLSVSDSYLKMNDADLGSPQYAINIQSDSIIDQVNISGVQAHWGSNAQTAGRVFGRLATNSAGAFVSGVSFQGCGATGISLLYSAGLTQGLTLSATDADSIRGSDLGCDFAGAGPLPLADIIQVTGASVLWEHAHPRGLA